MYCKLLSHLYFHPKQQSCYFPQDSDKYQSHFHSQQHFQQQSLHIPHPNVPIQFHCDNLLQYSNIPCYIPDKHLYSSILQHYRYMFQPYICCNQTRCQHRFCLIIIYFESDNIICITINHHKKTSIDLWDLEPHHRRTHLIEVYSISSICTTATIVILVGKNTDRVSKSYYALLIIRAQIANNILLKKHFTFIS